MLVSGESGVSYGSGAHRLATSKVAVSWGNVVGGAETKAFEITCLAHEAQDECLRGAAVRGEKGLKGVGRLQEALVFLVVGHWTGLRGADDPSGG